MISAFDRDAHFWAATLTAFSTFRLATNLAYVAQVRHNALAPSPSLPSAEPLSDTSAPSASSGVTDSISPAQHITWLSNLISSANKPGSPMLWIGFAAPIYLFTIFAIYNYFLPCSSKKKSHRHHTATYHYRK